MRRADALLELGRQPLGQPRLAADEREEALREGPRLARPVLEVLGEPLDQVVHVRVPAREAEGRRLADRQRADAVRVRGGDQQRDHAAVGVADQVGALAEQRRQLLGLPLEVDPLQQRSRRVAAAVRRDHLEPLLERRPHRRPGLGVPDAAVDQDDPHARSYVNKVGRKRGC